MTNPEKKLPKFAEWVLNRISKPEESFSVLGDFEEAYNEIYKNDGAVKANCYYLFQIMISLPPFFFYSIFRSALMFKNYVKSFSRNLRANKAYSFITVAGLSIGLFVCILMLLYVQDELSYDKFHENGEDIYRLVRHRVEQGEFATTFAPFLPVLLNDYDGMIEKAVRFYRFEILIGRDNERRSQEEKFFFTDANVFDVFSFPLFKGDAATALRDPFSVVLTQETASRYFGEEDPLGKILRLNNKFDLTVTGVLDKIPGNSHLTFDFLASFSTVKQVIYDIEALGRGNEWHPGLYTYLVIPEERSIAELEKSFPDFVAKIYGSWAKEDISLHLQPLHDIHLYSHKQEEVEANSDVAYIYLISIVAFLVLAIACINFMNLSTSRSARRAKEVGVRKVAGAQKGQLIGQFLFESVSFSVISLMISIFLVVLTLPWFNSFTGKAMTADILGNLDAVLGLTALVLIVGLVAGSYPAFYLSSFRPIKVFKGMKDITRGRSGLRKSLITFQFAVTIILIAGTALVNDQMSFIKNKRLGLNKDQVIAVRLRDNDAAEKFEVLRNEFSSNNDILNISFTTDLPFQDIMRQYVYSIPGLDADDYPRMQMFSVDYDFIEMMQLELVLGRDFDREIASDYGYSYILNEAAVKHLGWDDPLDKEFGRDLRTTVEQNLRGLGKIIGVVKDFHFKSLQETIEPVAMFVHPQKELTYEYMIIKTRSENAASVLDFLDNKWAAVVPQRPFEYLFLDDSFRMLYESEETLSQTFRYFSFFAIFVTCLGLLGLISFTAEQRVKEIGIRKVLGASIPELVSILLKEFVFLIIVSNIIAWPVAYFGAREWLQQFAYRVDPSVATLVLSTGIALFIALATVAFHTLKAAYANPVSSLRYE